MIYRLIFWLILIVLLLIQIIPSLRAKVYVSKNGQKLKTPWVVILLIIALVFSHIKYMSYIASQFGGSGGFSF